MGVPRFQAFLLPLLQQLSDGGERSVSNLADGAADILKLSETDRAETLASGTQRRYRNRTYWAKLYLAMAGLVVSTGRGRVKLTDRGRAALGQNLASIDVAYLRQFSEFQEFLARKGQRAQTNDSQIDALPEDEQSSNEASQTPEELIGDGYFAIRDAVANEILEKLIRASPAFFERIVIDVLLAMGYGGSRIDAGQSLGSSGDGGVDGMIKEDRLGLDSIYIQAKRWRDPVGAATVRDFAGSLEGMRANKGVLITTSRFTHDATDYITRIGKKIVLIDGDRLAKLMFDFNVGTDTVATYIVKRVDAEYFDES